jgi:tetratricopeptide (TPR) repeat protein
MIKHMPHSLDARQQMLNECRKYYQGNPYQLTIIDEFERAYCAADAIRWYTRPCFLFRLVNKALRTEDITALFIFRYFITDLCASLEAAHHQQITTCVYRGAILSRDEVEKYRIGNLVATNEFLSSSRDLRVAQTFIGLDPITGRSPSQNRQDQLQFVLFQIDIDPSVLPDIIMADVTDQSFFPDENEILFALGTTFEIVKINYDCEHYLWRIEMRPSTEIIHLNREYENYICERMIETNAIQLFGILLADMGEYAQSLNYFERLLARMSNDHEDRPNAYFSLARAYRFIGQNHKALAFFRRAEHSQRTKLPESRFDLARTLAGIGSVYCRLHDYRRELLYYKRAMNIYRQILPHDHIEIARSLNRLGFGYANQQQYTRALRYLTQSLTVYNKTVPDEHPDKAETLHNMGLVHHGLGHVDQTLDFYEKALKMRETSLPEDHPDIAETCCLLSMYYEEQQQRNVALEYAQRALRIHEKKLPYGHELLRRVEDVVERLQNRPTQ